ncbi:Protein tyrosine phosphatase-like family protein [Babesia bovis T2Bo]|uniref:very-long-chain (3R)-3-hydroxyacyl-CoA dehydratase n=1 Tax=Babesia bovis TaxID=5865 RepID=A7ANR8_BABBO|nr:Protein tyrosine phosphatase-like family protein [Babesia bovis T2Bo]EDO08202.1 Protein tyrosine phosphatase-like family protein [Babesia bovis T2Bo]|eukprot:XP_001611770.1 membrane protein [Babesia bovis T2Bo]
MYESQLPPRTTWYGKLVLLHYISSLCIWLSVELLLLTYFLRLEKGKWPSITTIANTNPSEFWNYIRPFFQCGLIAQCLTAVYAFFDGQVKGALCLLALEQCIRVVAVYFTALPLLKGAVSLRALLIVVSGWTLLSILRCLDALYARKGSRHGILEWISHKVFLLLYPLIAFEELFLLRTSATLLQTNPLAREFPSRMPNIYNFEIDVYLIYNVLPFVMVPSALIFYCLKLRNRKLKDL